MTTGLDDTLARALQQRKHYARLPTRAPPATHWAYHTLQDVLTQASGTANMTIYTGQRLGVRIGMTDRWASNVFCSKGRSMACFGLFILTRGSWNRT